MNIDACLSSKKMDFTTPKKFFDTLNERFTFSFDAACTRENCLCADGFFFDEGMDALTSDWPRNNFIFCNPPYGRSIGMFVEKAYREWLLGSKIVLLIPARVDTRWFHSYINDKAKIEFIKGRLKFGDETNSAPFPSMVAIYD